MGQLIVLTLLQLQAGLWLVILVGECTVQKLPPAHLAHGQLIILTLLQLQAGLWLVTGKCTIQELPPAHPPHGATHYPNAPPAAGRTVAGYK
jgi:hypothetical protein